MSKRVNDIIKERACRELEELAMKPEWSAGDLEAIYFLTETEKNILKTNKLSLEAYSGGDWIAEGSYRDGYSGQQYARDYYSRDGGRYSNDSGRQMFNNRMSRRMSDDSYGMDERQMMQDAYNRMR